MAHKVEIDFYHEGLRCVVIMRRRGHRCGYVGIPKGHKFHGIDYFNESIEHFDVHGGITYSEDGDGVYPVENEDNLWWFGYDCDHLGDALDTSVMSEEERKRYIPGDGVVRSLDYCVEECKKLAEQLSKFMPNGDRRVKQWTRRTIQRLWL